MPVFVPSAACDNAREFLERISPGGDHFKNALTFRDWAFRGHGDSTFRLVPTALRKDGRQRIKGYLRWPQHFVDAMSTADGQGFAAFAVSFTSPRGRTRSPTVRRVPSEALTPSSPGYDRSR